MSMLSEMSLALHGLEDLGTVDDLHAKLASALWVRRWVSSRVNPVVDVSLERGDLRGGHHVGLFGACAVRDHNHVLREKYVSLPHVK
jgi:hypothetical protein